MKTKLNHYVPETVESITLQQARKALFLIWLTGISSAISILIFILFPSNPENLGPRQLDLTQYEKEEAGSIDQLLLSSEEALLSDKKSFVNGALRFQWRNQEPDLNLGKNRIILYDNILKKKLQRIPRSQAPDFSVRPVPK